MNIINNDIRVIEIGTNADLQSQLFAITHIKFGFL